MGLNRAGSYGHIVANWVPVPADSVYIAVTTSEQDMGAMDADTFYLLTTTCDCFIKQGTAPIAASAANDSMLVPRGLPVLIDSAKGLIISIIGETAGKATLQKVVAAA